MKQRNYAIDFWKLVFCMVIVIYHTVNVAQAGTRTWFRGGYIGVEFFAIVSGYLLVASAGKKDVSKEEIGKETFRFIIGKVKSFLPYWIIFCAANFIILNWGKDILTVLQNLVNSLWCAGYLYMAGIGTGVLGVGWYISSMLLGMLILYPLCLKNKKLYTELLAPILVCMIIGYFAHRYKMLAKVSQWYGFFYTGTLRIFAEMLLGGFVYSISERISKISFTKWERIALTLLEQGGLSAVLVIICFRWECDYDFLILFIFFCCITSLFSNVSYSGEIFNRTWIKKISHYSLLCYLAQSTVFYIAARIPQISTLRYWMIVVVIVAADIVCAVLAQLLWNLVRRVRYGKKC